MKSTLIVLVSMLAISTAAFADDGEVVNALYSELSQAIDGAQRESTAADALTKCDDLEKRIQARSEKDDFWGRYLLVKAGRCKAFAIGHGAPASDAAGACGQALGVANKLVDLAAFAAAKRDAIPAEIPDINQFLKDEFNYAVRIGTDLKCSENIEALRPESAK